MNENPTEPSLMQLSIPRGWAVGDNKFYDVAPLVDPENPSFIENWSQGFIEDVLWLFEWRYRHDESGSGYYIPENNCYSIDLSWYPDGRVDGQYTLRLQWCGQAELVTVETLCSSSRHDIRDAIERWLNMLTTDYQAYHAKLTGPPA